MSQADQPAAMHGTSAFDALLTQCRDLASKELDAAIAGMLAKADEALAELITKTTEREQQKHYQEARELVRAKRAEFEKLFHKRFHAEFQQHTNKARKIGGSFADASLSGLELSLVADDDLEETLKFNEKAAKLRRICDDEINALDQRVGVLLGDADLQSEDNPFGPNAICDAYKSTCRNLVESVELRAVFLRLFDDHVLDAVRAVYKALNDVLVQNAILPKIRYGATRSKDGPRTRKVKNKDGTETEVEVEEPAAEDMFAALQKMFAAAGGGGGGGGGPGMGVGGVPLMQGAELLGSLTQLQLDGLAALGNAGAQMAAGAAPANILHELKTSSVGSSMGQMDAVTLDIVARLFDQLFDDPKIPLGVKGLIGRLQIPMLKVAIADKDLFGKKDHPARLLLDTLGEIAIRLPADFNTESKLFGHLETILQELISDYKEDIEIFGIVRDQLITLMKREDERIETEAHAASERVLQEEALAVAKSVAQEEIRTRVQTHPLPGPVLEFLIEQWIKLMILIHVRRGTASDAWKNALEAMDQLVWSVQPKDTTEDRRKLAALVPALLKRLDTGLEVAGVEGETRELFFADLMKFHTQIMSAPAKGKDAPAAPMPAAALDFTASVTVRNPYGSGEVQVSALDLDPDATAAPVTRHATDPDALRVGDWFEWKEKQAEGEVTVRPVRLIFITPRKTRYIFCDRSEKDYIECSRSEIVRRLRSGEAVLMDEEPEVPFFERIMGGVISKMKAIGVPA